MTSINTKLHDIQTILTLVEAAFKTTEHGQHNPDTAFRTLEVFAEEAQDMVKRQYLALGGIYTEEAFLSRIKAAKEHVKGKTQLLEMEQHILEIKMSVFGAELSVAEHKRALERSKRSLTRPDGRQLADVEEALAMVAQVAAKKDMGGQTTD